MAGDAANVELLAFDRVTTEAVRLWLERMSLNVRDELGDFLMDVVGHQCFHQVAVAVG